ncbi:hypothetical protein BAE44_0008672 [Dichanthelium oligosanthes]|uniref:Uncharacterized protein n=1 Tax=Dichanthelium oligosanthes TaxID=888268 RepID=A0A1E5VYZ8_9POAL|nr:hypothetical protein BAE44_0008672 [Dichanthelium oligosanthes]
MYGCVQMLSAARCRAVPCCPVPPWLLRELSSSPLAQNGMLHDSSREAEELDTAEPANQLSVQLSYGHRRNTMPVSFRDLRGRRRGGRRSPRGFRRKLHFLSSELHLDPFPLLVVNPALRSVSLPLLRDSLRLLTSHGLFASNAVRVFSAFPSLLTSPPDEPLRFISADAQLPPPLLRATAARSPRLLAASVPDTLRPALLFLRSRVALLREPLPLAAALLLAFSVERTLLPKLHFLPDATGSPTPLCVQPRLTTFSVSGPAY